MHVIRLISLVAALLSLTTGIMAFPRAAPSQMGAARAKHTSRLDALPGTLEPEKMTNAQRLARGLPPNKPVRLTLGHLKARASATVMTAVAAPKPTTTSSSCTTTTGTIEVSHNGNTNHTITSYLSESASADGSLGVTQNTSRALSVSYQSCRGDTNAAVNLTSHNAYLIGIPSGTAGDIIGPGSSNHAMLKMLVIRLLQAERRRVSNTVGSLQWTVDGIGNVFPQWIDANGSTSRLYYVYNTRSDSIILTGDVGKYLSAFPGQHAMDWHFIHV
ncbi:uncharacterized protein PHACADRAFT_186980 [Phanerochaete carnosa HHB-10118-sp]|uniref:Uncharacterized protein n=1 Tax=Phanerochaete carnosa (strain HHB-10118-sp) TaxID=650164 RepID=K5WMI8_PHACS|nr:uncharacterized protein PHACADRAFT_186980 [Phanerochaete carnosa HHB-10118-sp]EKM51517.1 hypothetical protein PHACADRAFT_186980 [Phanerochaete carnosa HHB-10118-sp]